MDAEYLFAGNLSYLENLYQEYRHSPGSFDSGWSSFFRNLESEKASSSRDAFLSTPTSDRIDRLAEVYRRSGHTVASINPLEAEKDGAEIALSFLEHSGFGAEAIGKLGESGNSFPSSLLDTAGQLQRRYCGSIGFEFEEIRNEPLKNRIRDRIESGYFEAPLPPADKTAILEGLMRAEFLESFLHTKHVGKKRFSAEGAETLIPMLTFFVDRAAGEGTKEIYFGMSHRGRINVIANVLQRRTEDLLRDFDEDYHPLPEEGTGDIRYHTGYSSDAVRTRNGQTIKLSVCANPSHLESVDTVVEGQAKARQVFFGGETAGKKIIPVLMHGDAAVAGQGTVYELLQLSRIKGYDTGGTVHIVVNNQIGFTASPEESRSTLYCTDIARAFDLPVFHVNAEDPEACVKVALFAFEIRRDFACDVFIDLNCYRKYGHNEGDEPSFIHPGEYAIIRAKKSILRIYEEKLIREGDIEEARIRELEEVVKASLHGSYEAKKENEASRGQCERKKDEFSFSPPKTGVDLSVIRRLTESFTVFPPEFNPHPKLINLMKERAETIENSRPVDWGLAEYLAYATLLQEGIAVRISGQDSARGTFSHRHAVWVDQKTKIRYFPLEHLSPEQGRFDILNSCLSEAGVLGFEYGYSTVARDGLTVWEAQFGDFANSAQVMIDQYIAAGEQKWGMHSGLVLFLPHGFEGQGPEHSSARLERFLSLAGNENMQIVNPTTPAQLFHLLRRQVKQKAEKPLIVFTPKGLLRHPECKSPLDEFVNSGFLGLIDDSTFPKNVKRLVLCSGRIYYELDAYRKEHKKAHVAIVRTEQLYPFDEVRFKEIVSGYPAVEEYLWTQEEPENMGAWNYMNDILPGLLPKAMKLSYAGRERSASPATGFPFRHKKEQAAILHRVFET